MKLSLPRVELFLLHKGLILVLVPLCIELVFVATLWKLLDAADGQTRRLQHAKQVTSELNEIAQLEFDVAKAAIMNKYIPSPAFREQTLKNMHALDEEMKLLDHLTASDARERQAFFHLKPAVQELELVVEQCLRKIDHDDPLPVVSENRVLQQIADCIGNFKDCVGELVDIERDAETQGSLLEAGSRQAVVGWLGFGIALNVFIAVGMAVFFYRELLERLNVLIENTRRLAANQTLLPRIKGGDEIEHLDRVFHDMAQALVEAAEYKKELIAMVSHDLRTPLTSIAGSLSLLEVGACGEIPPKAQEEVQVAERSATRLINLINDLLDIEKMEAGKLEMVIKQTDTQSIVEQSIEAIGAFAEQHAIKLRLPSQSYEIHADGERLVQVLVNLLSNAIKFSPDGSTIELEVKPLDGAFQFRVSDEGPGIPLEQQSAVFERFKQVEGITSAKLKGTGLGLAICKAIVNGHNGTIGLESQAGKGTTFWFEIPQPAGVTSDGQITVQTGSPSRTPS